MKLEQRIVDAVEALDLPDVDVSSAVLERIAEPERRFGQPRRPSSRALRFAAAIVVVAAAAVTFVEPARSAVARWLGIGATSVVVDPNVDPDDVRPPTRDAASPDDGVAVPNPIPPLGPPDVVAVDDATVVYGWQARDGWTRLDGDDIAIELSIRPVDGSPALKVVGGEGDVEFVDLTTTRGVRSALWLPADHVLVAEPGAAPVRASRVLLWDVGGRQFRLESNGQRDDVASLAASVDIDQVVTDTGGT